MNWKESCPVRSGVIGAAIVLATCFGLGACQIDEVPRDSTDLVIQNGGWSGIASISINGVRQGSLPPGGVLTLEDVGTGRIVIDAYRNEGDASPCATITRELVVGEAVHQTVDCSRP